MALPLLREPLARAPIAMHHCGGTNMPGRQRKRGNQKSQRRMKRSSADSRFDDLPAEARPRIANMLWDLWRKRSLSEKELGQASGYKTQGKWGPLIAKLKKWGWTRFSESERQYRLPRFLEETFRAEYANRYHQNAAVTGALAEYVIHEFRWGLEDGLKKAQILPPRLATIVVRRKKTRRPKRLEIENSKVKMVKRSL